MNQKNISKNSKALNQSGGDARKQTIALGDFGGGKANSGSLSTYSLIKLKKKSNANNNMNAQVGQEYGVSEQMMGQDMNNTRPSYQNNSSMS